MAKMMESATAHAQIPFKNAPVRSLFPSRPLYSLFQGIAHPLRCAIMKAKARDN